MLDMCVVACLTWTQPCGTRHVDEHMPSSHPCSHMHTCPCTPVSMCIHTYAYLYTHTHPCIDMCMCTHTQAHTSPHMYTYIYIHMHCVHMCCKLCVHAYTHPCTCTRNTTHASAHIHVMYTQTHVHDNMHTPVHKDTCTHDTRIYTRAQFIHTVLGQAGPQVAAVCSVSTVQNTALSLTIVLRTKINCRPSLDLLL